MGDEEEELCPLHSLALLGTMKYFPLQGEPQLKCSTLSPSKYPSLSEGEAWACFLLPHWKAGSVP